MATVPEFAHELNPPRAAVSLGLESLRAPTPNGDRKWGGRGAIRANACHRALTRSVFNMVSTAGRR